jgi:hypothetical protein
MAACKPNSPLFLIICAHLQIFTCRGFGGLFLRLKDSLIFGENLHLTVFNPISRVLLESFDARVCSGDRSRSKGS